MQDGTQNTQTQIQGINDIGIPPAINPNPSPSISSHQQDNFSPSAVSIAPVQKDNTQETSSSSLDELKKKALQELRPLIDQLDLSPEERFKTIIMIIQAGDDQTLISKAFEVCEQISDQKEKAQALLDIVNEINYFSQIESE